MAGLALAEALLEVWGKQEVGAVQPPVLQADLHLVLQPRASSSPIAMSPAV